MRRVKSMTYLTIGIVLLFGTVVLLRWGVPKEGQPSRVPARWGLATMFPMVVLILGVAGIALVAKGVFG